MVLLESFLAVVVVIDPFNDIKHQQFPYTNVEFQKKNLNFKLLKRLLVMNHKGDGYVEFRK